MTFVDRLTRCIVAWEVVTERTPERVQHMLDRSVKAHQYYSDHFPTYTQLMHWPGQTHQALPDKSQTYSVEGVNADLRHYLARLRRKSRSFSRCVHALRRAVKLFIYTYNPRQLYKWRYPAYEAFPMDFVSPDLWPLHKPAAIDNSLWHNTIIYSAICLLDRPGKYLTALYAEGMSKFEIHLGNDERQELRRMLSIGKPGAIGPDPVPDGPALQPNKKRSLDSTGILCYRVGTTRSSRKVRPEKRKSNTSAEPKSLKRAQFLP